MISDEVFSAEYNDLLKDRKVKKKNRDILIESVINDKSIDRNKFLDYQIELKKDFLKYNAEKNIVASEHKEQSDFVTWFRNKYTDVVIFAIRNGGSRSPAERAEQIREGVWAGVADLYVPEWKLWIEFKRRKGGVLSEKQIIFRDYVLGDKIGDSYILALGFENGKKQVETLIGY